MSLNREKVVKFLNPKRDTILYSTDGTVYSVFEFAGKFINSLSKHEQLVIQRNIHILNKKKTFDQPVVGNKDIYNKKTKPISAKSIGSRSALIEKDNIKLKGCRIDIDNHLSFPHEQLNFGDVKMVRTEIPFGVLSIGNVMSEILAYCFLKELHTNIIHTPLSVFEYIVNDKIAGYCLVSQSKNEQRLEVVENFYGLTIKELIYLKFIEQKINIPLTENEPDFGIDKEWYAKLKAHLLIKMNFNGGFRGVLNSNSGNDILFKDMLHICDFDTFTVIPIPSEPDYKFIKNFTLWCTIELLKTSPTIIDYINTNGISKKEATEKIWKTYKEKSLLWKYYHRMFIKRAEELGWNSGYIKNSFEYISQTQVFQEMILDNVLNSTVLKNSYPVHLSFYSPQGY